MDLTPNTKLHLVEMAGVESVWQQFKKMHTNIHLLLLLLMINTHIVCRCISNENRSLKRLNVSQSMWYTLAHTNLYINCNLRV